MNTFYIDPAHPLAAEVADEVRKFPADYWISVRGEWVDFWDEESQSIQDEEVVYSVSEAGSQDPSEFWQYSWEYVQAGDWIAAFDALRGR